MQGSKTSAEVCMPPTMNTEILESNKFTNYMKDGVQMNSVNNTNF